VQIQAGRNERPHLVQQKWNAGEDCGYHRQFEGREKGRCGLCGDHLPAFGKMRHERAGDEIPHFVGEEVERHEQHQHCQQTTQDARP
jgi:hypothetical protein